jgi:hypothetical protein
MTLFAELTTVDAMTDWEIILWSVIGCIGGLLIVLAALPWLFKLSERL